MIILQILWFIMWKVKVEMKDPCQKERLIVFFLLDKVTKKILFYRHLVTLQFCI